MIVTFTNRAKWEAGNPSYAAPANIAEKSTSPTEEQQQFRQARKQINGLIRSGCLGDRDKIDFSVTIVGHATPGHVPGAVGQSNDSITVTVQVLGYR